MPRSLPAPVVGFVALRSRKSNLGATEPAHCLVSSPWWCGIRTLGATEPAGEGPGSPERGDPGRGLDDPGVEEPHRQPVGGPRPPRARRVSSGATPGPYSMTARCGGPAAARWRWSRSSTASQYAALFMWARMSWSVARSGHGRRRPRAAAPAQPGRHLAPAGRRPVHSAGTTSGSRAGAWVVRSTQIHNASASIRPPRSPVMVVRRAAHRPPMPLHHVVISAHLAEAEAAPTRRSRCGGPPR